MGIRADHRSHNVVDYVQNVHPVLNAALQEESDGFLAALTENCRLYQFLGFLEMEFKFYL